MGQLLRWTSTAVSGLCEIQASAKLLRQPDGGGGGGRGGRGRQKNYVCLAGGWAGRSHKVGKGRSKVHISHARDKVSDSRRAYF